MPLSKFSLRPHSIGQRFALAIGAGAGAILVALALANYLSGRELLLQQTSSEALKEVNDEMRSMDGFVERMAMLPYVIGATQESKAHSQPVKVQWLAALLEKCPIPAVYGLFMVLDGKDWRDPSSDTWVDRKSWPHEARLKYDFHDLSQDWYRGAKESGKLHVTQPYFDEGGSDIDMISITQPVYGTDGTFVGVAGVDVALNEMRKIVRKLHIRDFGTDLTSESGKATLFTQKSKTLPINLRESAYLISQTGAIIVSPEESQDQPALKPGEEEGKNSKAAHSNLPSQGVVTSLPGIKEILSAPSGWLRLKDGSDKVIYWAEGRTTGWKLVLEVPYEIIVAPARKLAVESAIIGGLGMILLIGVVFFVARRVSGPITELQSVATNFEKGSYNQGRETLDRIEQRSDELGRFARSFSTMAREIRQREERLSEWNANLEKTVRDRTADLAQAMVKVEKANAKMSAELGEAATYSRAVLPERLTHPVRTDWVFVTSSELGGDSFGYHWLDDDTLSLYLLDVCGHGVGAALLSVSVVNVLRTSSLADTDFRDPAAVLGNLNAAFPMEKHNEMYFTAWYGIYKRSTGQMSYACGGHPPAVLVKPDGSHQHLSAKGAVVGVFPTPYYESLSVAVPERSRLYLFSDGAYEIDRPDGTMMTYEELSQLLRTPDQASKLSSRLDSIVTEVRRQQQREDFADDFSLVEFDFLKEPVRDPIDPSERSGHDTLILRNELAEIGRLHPFLKAYCEREGTPMEQVFDFEIILEELVTNVIKYGGLNPGEECCLIELIRSGNHLTIHFSDSGIPFNPLEQEEVDTSLPIEERPIGGLGIHFIKKLTDTQSYERREGRNVLTLTKELCP